MKHLSDNSNKLELIIERLRKNKIFCHIETSGNTIIDLQTDDKELIRYAKNNNPNLE